MQIEKLIPNGAGLGGGSSDAAFVLKMLNELLKTKISDHDLQLMASEIGSDCAFFVENKPAFVTGRGELMNTIDLSLKGYYLVIVKPDIHISSSWAYSQVEISKNKINFKNIATTPITEWSNYLTNDFEDVVFKKYPSIKLIKDQLIRKGAKYACMSGSGSAVFGIFDIKPNLRNDFIDYYYCEISLS